MTTKPIPASRTTNSTASNGNFSMRRTLSFFIFVPHHLCSHNYVRLGPSLGSIDTLIPPQGCRWPDCRETDSLRALETRVSANPNRPTPLALPEIGARRSTCKRGSRPECNRTRQRQRLRSHPEAAIEEAQTRVRRG